MSRGKEGLLRKRDTLGILAVVALLSVSISLFGQQSAGDCSSLLSDAEKKCIYEDYKGALVSLHALLEQPSLLEKCPVSDKEKTYFYHSYCHLQLNACNNPETEDAIQLLKINCPDFDADFASKMAQPDYSWVSQAWKDCYRNVKIPIDKIIDRHYQLGKKLRDQNDDIGAVQEFMAIIQLIESYDTAHKFAQWLELSRGFVDLCQRNLISKWSDLASHNDFESLKKLKDKILSIDKHDVYLKDLGALFDSLDTQSVWNDHQNKLASLINEQALVQVDFAALQEQLKKVKSAKVAGLGLASVNVDDSLIASFRAYAEHLGRQYYVKQEDAVKNVFDAFENYIVANCPDSAAAAKKIYNDTLNAPLAVYDKFYPGVAPPVGNKNQNTMAPPCVIQIELKGKVTLVFKVGPAGKVVSDEIVTREYHLNKDQKISCVKIYLDVLKSDLKREVFQPAFKVKNRPAAAPFAGSLDGLAPQDRVPVFYSTSRTYNLK